MKEGQQAVFFTRDGWDRGIILVDGCWYVVAYEADNKVWRIAYTDRWYDFNVCFVGPPDQLAAAVRQLLAGETVTVRCRAKPKEPGLQTVRYTMKKPKEKTVVEPAGPETKPAR